MSRKKGKRTVESELVESLLNDDVSLEIDDEVASEEISPPPKKAKNRKKAGGLTAVLQAAKESVLGAPDQDDATMQISTAAHADEFSAPPSQTVTEHEATQRFEPISTPSSELDEQIRFGRVAADKVVGSSAPVGAAETSLAQSEHLRVAQNRILGLEQELERIRQENEQLIAAGETLRRKSEDLVARAEKAELHLNEEVNTFREEKRLYKESLRDRDRENLRLKEKIEELELRLESDLKKIRVRERELENRLELVKMEEVALIRSKDEVILDLKRKIDKLNAEMDNYRGRSLELHKQVESDQDRLRRTVRALRIALSMLEDGEAQAVPLKKAE